MAVHAFTSSSQSKEERVDDGCDGGVGLREGVCECDCDVACLHGGMFVLSATPSLVMVFKGCTGSPSACGEDVIDSPGCPLK